MNASPSEPESDSSLTTVRWRVFMLNKSLHSLRSMSEPHDDAWQEKETRCAQQLASAKEQLASLEMLKAA